MCYEEYIVRVLQSFVDDKSFSIVNQEAASSAGHRVGDDRLHHCPTPWLYHWPVDDKNLKEYFINTQTSFTLCTFFEPKKWEDMGESRLLNDFTSPSTNVGFSRCWSRVVLW